MGCRCQGKRVKRNSVRRTGIVNDIPPEVVKIIMTRVSPLFKERDAALRMLVLFVAVDLSGPDVPVYWCTIASAERRSSSVIDDTARSLSIWCTASHFFPRLEDIPIRGKVNTGARHLEILCH